jgi:glycosyltransferase involved in cell wall biosynthesis
MAIGITAIIPTYNRDRTLARAIRSAIDQEFAPAEILVVDDGSTDQTRAVVESFGDRIRYIPREHSGVSATRNAGVAESRSEWVAFLDSDDYWTPTHLSRMARAIESTVGRACCYFANALTSPEHGGRTYWQMCGFEPLSPFFVLENASEWAFMRIQPMLLGASVMRQETYWEIGGLNESMVTREDTLLFYKLALQYPLCAVDHIAMLITDDGAGRLTRAYDSRQFAYWAATVLMYKEILSRVAFRRPIDEESITASLGDAHFGMAKIYLRRGSLVSGAQSLAAAAFASPRHFASTITSMVARKWKALWIVKTRS